jgi:hypothetical protein
MTAWPDPERPRLPSRPPKALRDPTAPRPRPTRDDRWVWGGLTLGLGLVIGYFGYWSNWFGLTAPPAPPSDASSDGAALAAHATTGSLVVLALFAVLVLGLATWLVRGWRDRGPRMDELPEDEQARRRQAAVLLQQVEPEVSEAEAASMLRPPWLEEAARKAAERTRGGADPDGAGPGAR